MNDLFGTISGESGIPIIDTATSSYSHLCNRASFQSRLPFLP